jgi:hypothetical protein
VSDPASDKDQRPYDPDRTRFVAIGILWAGAGVLSVVAAYQNVYEVGYGHGTDSVRNALDAWGSYSGPAAITPGAHGPRYAYVLVACAVAFAALAVSSLGRAFGLRARRFDGPAAAAGLGVAGVLTGLLAALYLEINSTLAGVRARIGAEVATGERIRPDVVTTVGTCAYFALAALACGLVAVGFSTRRKRAGDRLAG